MGNFAESYEQILRTLKEIEPKSSFLNRVRVPKLSDIELVPVALTAACLSIGSGYQLFGKLPVNLSDSTERSVHDRRRRRLFPFNEKLRLKMADLLVPYEDYFIVDSLPLEVCKLSRQQTVKICRET